MFSTISGLRSVLKVTTSKEGIIVNIALVCHVIKEVQSVSTALSTSARLVL